MRYQPFRRKIRDLLNARPTVGALMDLCESNYLLLLRLVPDLPLLTGSHLSSRPGSATLYLDVLDHSTYTSLVRLTHRFPHDDGHDCDPDLRLRVYFDARQVEVVDLRQTDLPLDRIYHHPGFEQKWRVNQFLARWLVYCLDQGHGFDDMKSSRSESPGLVTPALA